MNTVYWLYCLLFLFNNNQIVFLYLTKFLFIFWHMFIVFAFAFLGFIFLNFKKWVVLHNKSYHMVCEF
jgi:hypothetical protein